MSSQQVEIDIQQLKEAMRFDCVVFFSFYLQDELDKEVPQLHEEIWDELVKIIDRVNLGEWTDHIQKLFCVPRGHAKSTLTKLAIILFFRYSKLSFALYASLTSVIAKAACRDIVRWLTSDTDNAVWGKTIVEKSNETEQLWILRIGSFYGGQKRVILKALGADQQVRGTLLENKRPELLVIDDCEDNDTAKDEKTQAALDTWLMGNLMKATAGLSVRIMLGNMINSRTMLYRLSKDPEWNPTVYGAIIRDKQTGLLKPLWPGLYTLPRLLKEYKSYRQKGLGHVWLYEMMNMTADSVFKTGMENAVRLPRPNPDQVTAGIIILDPAFGQNAWNDESALTVHVRFEGSGIPHVVESRKGRKTESQLLDDLIEMSYYWNIATWGIESVAAQKLLIPLFKLMLADRKIRPDIFTMLPLPSGGTAKSSRIYAFVTAVSSGNYGVVDEEVDLFDSLIKYDPDTDKHEDLPDSAAYGPIAWAQAGQFAAEGNLLKQKLALMQQPFLSQQTVVPEHQLVPY